MPIGDALYFATRLAVGSSIFVAAWTSLRIARAAYYLGRPWRVAGFGGSLLLAAGGLSTWDAVDNIVLRPANPILPIYWMWLLLFDSLVPIWAFLLIAGWRERDRLLAELLRLSITDQLTGALNRRGFLERAATSIAQGRRSGAHPSIILMDIDRFKTINDSHGHAAGDEVLRNLAAVLLAITRPGDLLGRVGGEEFALFLHDADAAVAASIADRLRLQIRDDVKHPSGAGHSVTLSSGVAPIPGTFEPEAALSMGMTRADAALYQAKSAGRDRIVATAPWDSTPATPPMPNTTRRALTGTLDH